MGKTELRFTKMEGVYPVVYIYLDDELVEITNPRAALKRYGEAALQLAIQNKGKKVTIREGGATCNLR